MRAEPTFFRRSAKSMIGAACRISRRGGAWGWSRRKVFLSDVAHEIGVPMKRLAPMLVHFNNLGWIGLARADLVGGMDPKKVRDSEIDLDGRTTFHFLEVDPDQDC